MLKAEIEVYRMLTTGRKMNEFSIRALGRSVLFILNTHSPIIDNSGFIFCIIFSIRRKGNPAG